MWTQFFLQEERLPSPGREEKFLVVLLMEERSNEKSVEGRDCFECHDPLSVLPKYPVFLSLSFFSSRFSLSRERKRRTKVEI